MDALIGYAEETRQIGLRFARFKTSEYHPIALFDEQGRVGWQREYVAAGERK